MILINDWKPFSRQPSRTFSVLTLGDPDTEVPPANLRAFQASNGSWPERLPRRLCSTVYLHTETLEKHAGTSEKMIAWLVAKVQLVNR